MEFVVFTGVLLFIFLFMIVQELMQAKKEEKRFRNSLLENYGKEPPKEYSLERFARLDSYLERHKEEKQLDDITWNDLGMDEVFCRIDRTLSAAGEEYLYFTLRNIFCGKEKLDHLEEVTGWFLEQDDTRIRVQLLLKKLGHLGKYSLYDYLDNLDYLGERNNRKILLLNLLYLLFASLLFVQPAVGILGIVVCMLGHILTYFREKKVIEPYITSFAYVLRMINVCEELVRQKIPVYKKELEDLNEALKSLRELKRGSFWVMAGNQGKIGGNPLDIIADYLRMILHLDIWQFNLMLRKLRLKTNEVNRLLGITGYLDMAISVGGFRRSLEGYCIPQLEENANKVYLHMEGGWHPLLTHPVKNSIRADRGVLLTGSNASGKSTFLKMVAVNAVLAQTIHTCTAESYHAPVFRIFSSMALRDSIQNGESYYIVEIRSLKRILDAAQTETAPVLSFVDEVLRGTNTVERIAAATQILIHLSESGVLCFTATHDIEMTELLKDCYDNYHFEEVIRDGDISFPYELLPGRAGTRNAIRLLALMGYDKEITERAAAQAEDFIQTGKWSVQTLLGNT
jgi:hypothetical protein